MNAYVLVFASWINTTPGYPAVGGWQFSQQEYADMQSCQNAARITMQMIEADNRKIKWACLPKKN